MIYSFFEYKTIITHFSSQCLTYFALVRITCHSVDKLAVGMICFDSSICLTFQKPKVVETQAGKTKKNVQKID